MGTSTRNSGQSGHNPLVPTWLDYSVPFNSGYQVILPQQPSAELQQPIQLPIQPIPPNADANRFRGPRISFSHFVSSGGRNTSTMRKGVSSYVRKSLGGSSNATKRLGSSRVSTARLYGFLHSLSGPDGFQNVARLLSLDTLVGLSAAEFFIRLAEFVCPDGGSEDEGISRSAYYDVVADNPDIMDKNVEDLTENEIESISQRYMTKVVMQQIMNGIANNSIRFSETLEQVSHIEDAVEEFIGQSVSDAWAELKQNNVQMTNEWAKEITDEIYLKVFEILEGLGD